MRVQPETSLDIVRLLANQSDILTLTFRAYVPRPGFQARLDMGHPDVHGVRPDPDLWCERMGAGDAVEFIDGHVVGSRIFDAAVILGSEVETVHGSYHLLLIDFLSPVSAENQDRPERGIAVMGWTGWLVESGSSYHFIGNEPMSQAAWTVAMGSTLLMEGTDTRYIGHRLVAGSGGVRLTACTAKPMAPVVVARIGVEQPTATRMAA